MKHLAFIVFCLCGSLAGAGQERGGGNFVGMEAMTSAQAMLYELSQNPTLAQQAHLDELDVLIKKIKVIGVPQTLPVTLQNVTQLSTAINDKSSDLIQINIAQWNSAEDPRPRKAIMLHEMESLLGYESTGEYPISSVYLASTGYMDALRKSMLRPAKTAHSGFDLAQYGVLTYCDVHDCEITVPALDRQNKSVCKNSFQAVYQHLVQSGKIIVNTIPCSDLKLDMASDRPDFEVHTGSFSGRIDFH